MSRRQKREATRVYNPQISGPHNSYGAIKYRPLIRRLTHLTSRRSMPDWTHGLAYESKNIIVALHLGTGNLLLANSEVTHLPPYILLPLERRYSDFFVRGITEPIRVNDRRIAHSGTVDGDIAST